MKPARNLKYLAWIRTLPCLICGRTGGVEAAHTGPHGMAQKSPDTSAVPLCVRHHRTGRDSYHKLGARAFERRHGLDLRTVVERLNERPYIRIENGSFVGRYGNEEFVLGRVEIGIPSAVRSFEFASGCRKGCDAPGPVISCARERNPQLEGCAGWK
jgi:hypothetical protein